MLHSGWPKRCTDRIYLVIWVASSLSCRGIAFQDLCQLLRSAQCDAVPSRYFIRDDVQALGRQSAEEAGRERTILTAQHEFRRYVGPCVEWPGLTHAGL